MTIKDEKRDTEGTLGETTETKGAAPVTEIYPREPLVEPIKAGKKTAIGLKAIAVACNVSINTVSRALRDCSDISKATKNRIRAKAVEMGYVPNHIAAALKLGNTKTVSLIFNNLKSPYFCVMANRIVFLLRQQGYNSLIVPNFSTVCTKENIQEALVARADAIVSFLEPTEDAALTAKLNALPIILVGRQSPYAGVDQVYTDDRKGGTLAADELLKEGAKKFIYIAANAVECSIRRYRGFLDRLQAEDPNISVPMISESDLEMKLPWIASEGFDGIFCFNEQIALDTLQRLKAMGLAGKVHIVGYDGLGSQVVNCEKVPCVGYDYEAIADKSFEILMDRISDRFAEDCESCIFDVRMVNVDGDETKVENGVKAVATQNA